MAKEPSSAADLQVPVYLDIQGLLDLVASQQGGFTMVEQVTETKGNTNQVDANIEGEASSSFPGLLKLRLRSGLGSSRQNTKETEVEQERTHTHGSLLHQLREELVASEKLVIIESAEDLEKVNPGDFIEVHGQLRLNPVSEGFAALQNLGRIMKLAATFASPAPPTYGGNQTGRKKQGQQKAPQSEEQRQVQQFLAALPELEQLIRHEGSEQMILRSERVGASFVGRFFHHSSRDGALQELSEGKVRVLAKVRERVSGEEEIDLLEGTDLRHFGVQLTDVLAEAFNSMSDEGFNVPAFESAIAAPAVHILPIAAYV